MTKKHTPGPWAFCNETLCQANGNFLHLGKWIESPGLGRAAEPNKRLIESAPELLEALIDLLDRNPQIDRGVLMARAAIAKATGEQA